MALRSAFRRWATAMNHFWRARLRPVLDLRPGLILRDSALLLRLLPCLFLQRPLPAQDFFALSALLLVGLLTLQFLLPVRLLLHCPLLEQRRLAVPALQILLTGQP